MTAAADAYVCALLRQTHTTTCITAASRRPCAAAHAQLWRSLEQRNAGSGGRACDADGGANQSPSGATVSWISLAGCSRTRLPSGCQASAGASWAHAIAFFGVSCLPPSRLARMRVTASLHSTRSTFRIPLGSDGCTTCAADRYRSEGRRGIEGASLPTAAAATGLIVPFGGPLR